MMVAFSVNALAATSITRDYSYTPIFPDNGIFRYYDANGFWTDRIWNPDLSAGGFKIARAEVGITMLNSQYAVKNIRLTMTEYGYHMDNNGAVYLSNTTQTITKDIPAPANNTLYVVYIPNSLWTGGWHFRGYDKLTLTFTYYNKQDPATTFTYTKSATHTTPSYGY
jgi:hypothetical protein